MERSRSLGSRLLVLGSWLTVAAVVAAVVAVLLSGTDPANTSAPGYLGLAYAAAAVLLAVFLVGAFITRVDVGVLRGFPWLVGAVSLIVSWAAWLVVWLGHAELGGIVYRGLRVPMGMIQFWDLSLVLQSVDCASVGVDVYSAHNGCLQDPSIYAPGTLWLQWIPGIGNSHVQLLGVLMMIVSSFVLLVLARWSVGLGQIVLLIAAVGAPWLLMLERGNMDAVVVWVAVAAVALVTRSPRLWAWSVAALLIWIVGTWKYYPFAMGLMLVPVLRLRRGWTLLAGFLLASLAFVALTWSNFVFSSSSNAAMIDYGDTVVLGRVPVVARMLGTVVGAGGVQTGDVLVFLVVIAALVWGIGYGLSVRPVPDGPSMLAVAGSVLFLASVAVAGFGWGYKAVFLLLVVPLVSGTLGSSVRGLVVASFIVLALTAVSAVVVWNTVLATTAGLVVSGFALGAAGALLVRSLMRPGGEALVGDVDVAAGDRID